MPSTARMLRRAERAVRVLSERRHFWSRYADLTALNLDTAAEVRVWANARNALIAALRQKMSAPLERVNFAADVLAILAEYERVQAQVARISDQFQSANQAVRLVKEQAAAGNVGALESDLAPDRGGARPAYACDHAVMRRVFGGESAESYDRAGA